MMIAYDKWKKYRMCKAGIYNAAYCYFQSSNAGHWNGYNLFEGVSFDLFA
jgi:hypothetical protein